MWKFQYFLCAFIDDGVLFILFPIYLQSNEENLSSVNRSVSGEKHKQLVTSTLMRSLFVLICCSCTFLLHSSVRSRFFQSQSPQLPVDVFKVCLFGASFAAFCALFGGEHNRDDQSFGKMTPLNVRRVMMRAFICSLSLSNWWDTQKTSFSYHLHSIRPLLIPWSSPVQCCCIWWSQAATVPCLQHSILITFLCFLPSFHPSSLQFLVITQEKPHNRRGDRNVVLISWHFLPSWFWMTDNLLKHFF